MAFGKGEGIRDLDMCLFGFLTSSSIIKLFRGRGDLDKTEK